MNPTILFLTAMWKRRSIEHITFSHLRRLADKVSDRACVKFLAVGSEGDTSRYVAETYGFDYIEHPNSPLGSKWNALWNESLLMNADVRVIVGSDNIVPASSIDEYLAMIDLGLDFLGMEGCYMINPLKSQGISFDGYCGEKQGKSVGGGRAYSAAFSKRIGESPFGDHLQRGLDSSFQRSVDARCDHYASKMLPPGDPSQVMELKSEINMWHIENFTKGVNNLFTNIGYGECLSLIDQTETLSMVRLLESP